MPDLVSILIPAYNAERWIADTLKSAIKQTWENKEIIVLVDGATDKTYEIAKNFQSRLVSVYHQDNAGVCRTRNNLLERAQGDFIQWLDADDLLHPEKIARQLAVGGGGRNSRTLLTAEWGRFFFRQNTAKFAPDSLWRDHGPVDWIITRLNDNVWMNPAVWLVSRRLTDLAGPWDERLSSSGDDDGEYICRVAGVSDGVRFVRGARAYYRIGSVGSLNWNMERSEKSLDALYLSIRLTILNLLSLENSQRTKAATLRYLNNFAGYFYASDQRYLSLLQDLANEIGSGSPISAVRWKYYLFDKLMGPKITRNIINNWRVTKLIAQSKWDKFFYLQDYANNRHKIKGKINERAP